MVLKSIEEPISGKKVFSTSDPSGSLLNIVGLIVGLTVGLYALFLARNQGVPILDTLISRVTGNRVTAQQGDGGFGEVF